MTSAREIAGTFVAARQEARALPGFPGEPPGNLNLSYRVQDEAIALWEKMYEKHPGPNAAAVGLAMTYLERKEHAKALPYFQELVKAMPDNEEFRNGLEAAKAGTSVKGSE